MHGGLKGLLVGFLAIVLVIGLNRSVSRLYPGVADWIGGCLVGCLPLFGLAMLFALIDVLIGIGTC